MAVEDLSRRTLPELVSLAGKVAVVTGAARGIGLAIAARLGEAGADVLLADVDGPLAEKAAGELAERWGHRALGTACDVADPQQVAALAARAVTELGGLDVWVSNAGIYPATPLLELTDEQWHRVLSVNLDGAFTGAREAARQMVAAGRGGVLVTITSTASFRAHGPGMAAYVSSKHAVHGLTKSLAIELAPHGIRVLSVAPTAIDTPGVESQRAAMAAAGAGDLVEQVASQLPLGRIGVPDDVARVVLFAVSGLAGFMTGSTLAVDAGDLVR